MKFEIKPAVPVPPTKQEPVMVFELKKPAYRGREGATVLVNGIPVIDFVEENGKLIARRYGGFGYKDYIATETDKDGHTGVIKVSY